MQVKPEVARDAYLQSLRELRETGIEVKGILHEGLLAVKKVKFVRGQDKGQADWVLAEFTHSPHGHLNVLEKFKWKSMLSMVY